MHNSFEELINENQVCCSKSKVASENGKRFEIISSEDFIKIRIDDCLIKSKITEKCDFGFVRHSNDNFYFIELKGTQIQKAFDQIVATINYFETNLIKIPKEKRFGFIISSSIPKAGISANILKQTFAKKYGKDLEIKNRELKHMPK
jgi:hypothetical protein